MRQTRASQVRRAYRKYLSHLKKEHPITYYRYREQLENYNY